MVEKDLSMKAKIDTNGTIIISKDPFAGDADDYALARWVKDWQQGLGCISIQFETPGGKVSHEAITQSNTSAKLDIVKNEY